MAAVSLFSDTNMAAVTSCENTLYNTEIRPFFNTKTGQRILASGPSTLMT